MTTIITNVETGELFADTRLTVKDDAVRMGVKIVPRIAGEVLHQGEPIVSIGLAGTSLPSISAFVNTTTGDFVTNLGQTVHMGAHNKDAKLIIILVTVVENGYKCYRITDTAISTTVKCLKPLGDDKYYHVGTGGAYSEPLCNTYGLDAMEAIAYLIDAELDPYTGGMITKVKPEVGIIDILNDEAFDGSLINARNKIHSFFVS